MVHWNWVFDFDFDLGVNFEVNFNIKTPPFLYPLHIGAYRDRIVLLFMSIYASCNLQKLLCM